MRTSDPFSCPEQLIRRVYAYAAYRVGDGPDAEDVTSETFARALRRRSTYDPRRGEPVAWLIGIARRCVSDLLANRLLPTTGSTEVAAPGDLEEDTARRVVLARALTALDDRERELIALRYGADLTARRIAELQGMKTNAVEVALHRALERLRRELGQTWLEPVEAAREAVRVPRLAPVFGVNPATETKDPL